jgi:poly-gamma-glutamate capsule biosynthesis protein CapA/YwtB (metallophosphatase superfamily)
MRKKKQNIVLLIILLSAVLILLGIKAHNHKKLDGTSSLFKTDEALTRPESRPPNKAECDKSLDEPDIKREPKISSEDIEKGIRDYDDEATGFDDDKRDVESLNIKAVGDIVLGRGVEYHLKDQEKDYTYPFQYVVDILRKGDIVFGNLEVPMTESDKGLDPAGKYVIKSTEKAVEGIKYAGFNVLNLANNHIMDYYEKGLFDTVDVLDKSDILYCGAGENIDKARMPAILNIRNTTIAVLGYTDMSEYIYKGDPMISFAAGENKSGVAPRRYEFIKEDIEKIRHDTDIIVISLHWGVEDSFEVTSDQREFAHKLIDGGADIILGHHPHRFQGIEVYKDKPIIYSMGNFIFDQNNPSNQESFIVDMQITDKRLISMELIPVRTISKTHIIIPKGEEAKELLKRELELCGKLGSKCAIADDKIVFNIK